MSAPAGAESLCLAPYQEEAVARLVGLLDRRSGALLADEVGLGKSWIGAAVARHFSNRGLAVEAIVPRTLVRQWSELLDAFDVAAELLTHDSLRGRFSFPGDAKERLLLVDEAHRFRNPSTQRYEALALRSVATRILLITATPICNRLEDLSALIRLIASDAALADAGVLSIDSAFENRCADEIRVILEELAVRRGWEVLPEYLRFGSLRREVIRFGVVDDEAPIRAAIMRLNFPLIAATESQDLVLRDFLNRRLQSSVAALVESVRRQQKYYRRALQSLSRGFELRKPDYRQIFGSDPDEVLYQDLLFQELWTPRSGENALVQGQVEREIAALADLETLLAGTADRKVERFLALLREISHEQILVFTSAIATARALFHASGDSTARGLVSSRFCWSGRFRKLSVEQVLDSFQEGRLRLLILTDMGAEGLNLQRGGIVVHYDLPWNPVRVEQRNGRIHRIGQLRDQVRAVYFLPEQETDRKMMRVIAAKNRVRRAALDATMNAATGGGMDLSVLRPRISRREPQPALFARLAGERLLDDEVSALLLNRYRAGAERILQQLQNEFLDATRRDYLVHILTRELRLTTAR